MNIVTATIQGESKAAIISSDLEHVIFKDIAGTVHEMVKLAQRASILDEALSGLASRVQRYCDGFTGCNGDKSPYFRIIQQVAGV